MNRIKMREMADNQAGVISAIKVAGELGRRIRDMGLIPGTEVKIKGRAPLYDPIVLQVKKYILALRNSEAEHIMVDVDE
ncbi:MAG: iron transporter FeoA [Desulfobacterium sp.]|nr:iron transporter FeoA [Desulfobacterium sp.]